MFVVVFTGADLQNSCESSYKNFFFSCHVGSVGRDEREDGDVGPAKTELILWFQESCVEFLTFYCFPPISVS